MYIISNSSPDIYHGHRRREVDDCISRAANFIESMQKSDGSWSVFGLQTDSLFWEVPPNITLHCPLFVYLFPTGMALGLFVSRTTLGLV
jgi:hypothetical protein